MSPLATAPTHSIQIRIPQFIEWPRRRSLGTCEPTLHCACSWGTPASPPPPSSSSAGSRSSSPASFLFFFQPDISFRCKLLSLFSMSFCPHPQQKCELHPNTLIAHSQPSLSFTCCSVGSRASTEEEPRGAAHSALERARATFQAPSGHPCHP